MKRSEPVEPTISEALIEVVSAGQQLVVDRVDLALIEVRQVVAESVTRAAPLVCGGLLLLIALVALDAALVDGLARLLPRPLAFVVCAVLNGALGGWLVFAGMRRRTNS